MKKKSAQFNSHFSDAVSFTEVSNFVSETFDAHEAFTGLLCENDENQNIPAIQVTSNFFEDTISCTGKVTDFMPSFTSADIEKTFTSDVVGVVKDFSAVNSSAANPMKALSFEQRQASFRYVFNAISFMADEGMIDHSVENDWFEKSVQAHFPDGVYADTLGI